jgi:RNA polymerase sigma-70 factor (ECF subfamily)
VPVQLRLQAASADLWPSCPARRCPRQHQGLTLESDARFRVEALVRDCGSALQGFLYRRTRSHADAIELAQETYVRMLQIEDMDAIREPKAYMFSVAANLAVDHASRQRRARGTPDISDPALEAELARDSRFAEQIDQGVLAARLHRALRELPARCRAAFWLQHGHGMSCEEVARHLGVSRETVKKDLSRVVLHCRQRLER